MKRPAKANAKSGRNKKPPKKLSWQRDPEGMRKRILGAATAEFARHGYGGARIDRIANDAGANKRMLYYHVGNKDDLYLAVLEGAYEHIRAAERALNLEALGAKEAIARLLRFTWEYYLENPEFIALLNDENLHRARHLKRSRKVKELHSPFVALIGDILKRGEAAGEVRHGIDPVQLYVSIASLCYFYQSNSATLGVIFGRDLMTEEACEERLEHMTDLVLTALSPAAPRALDPVLTAPVVFNQRVKI